MVGDAEHYRLRLPAVAPRGADPGHGIVYPARGDEPRRRRGGRLLRLGTEPRHRRHRAGGVRRGLWPVGEEAAGTWRRRYGNERRRRRRSCGEGVVGVHKHAHILDDVAQDGPVGIALQHRRHVPAFPAEAVAAGAPEGPRLRRPGDHPRERRAPQDDGRHRRGEGARAGGVAAAQGLPVRDARGKRERRVHAGAALTGLLERADLRAPARRVRDDGVHAVLSDLPRRREPGGGGEAAQGDRCVLPPRPRSHVGRSSDQVPLPRSGGEGVDEVLHGVAIGGARDLRACGDRWLCPSKGYMGVDGTRCPRQGPNQLPRPGAVSTGAVRPCRGRAEEAASVRVHPVRNRPQGLHRPEVRHSGNQARGDPPLPALRVPALSQHGVPSGVPVWDCGQLQAWCQASGHQEARELLDQLLVAV